MMNNGFTGIIVTASLKPRATPLNLILKQINYTYTPPTGDNVVLRFNLAPYTPPTVV